MKMYFGSWDDDGKANNIRKKSREEEENGNLDYEMKLAYFFWIPSGGVRLECLLLSMQLT